MRRLTLLASAVALGVIVSGSAVSQSSSRRLARAHHGSANNRNQNPKNNHGWTFMATRSHSERSQDLERLVYGTSLRTVTAGWRGPSRRTAKSWRPPAITRLAFGASKTESC